MSRFLSSCLAWRRLLTIASGGGAMTSPHPGHRRNGHARAARRLAPAGRRLRRPGAQPAPPSGRDGVEFLTGDLATGEGAQAAVAGVGTVVHLAGSAKGDEDKAGGTWSGRHPRQGCGILSTSRSSAPTGSRSPAASTGPCSATSRPSGLPNRWWPTRAAVDGAAGHPVPRPGPDGGPAAGEAAGGPGPGQGSWFQPVDAEEVAARLVELTLGPPAGLVPDLGGPRVYRGADLVRGYLQASHRHRPIVPVWLPGKAARAGPGRREPVSPNEPWVTEAGRTSSPERVSLSSGSRSRSRA